MSFAVCRMEKMKSYDLKGMQFHNQRERESRTNFDIDAKRSHLNYDFVNDQKIDYNERVKEIIESQKTGTRKTRKDAVLVNELLITSDRAFFDGLDLSEQRRFFEESYQLFSERYGKQNVAYAVVHMDEKTPHMHMGIVPMRDGKLQGKNVFNRMELQWIQDEFPKHMQRLGFDLERGEKGSDREHLRSQEFKEKTLKEKVQGLEQALHQKEEEKQAIEIRIDDLTRSLEDVKKMDDVDVKPEKKMGLFTSDRVILDRNDFESIKTLAENTEAFRIENKHLKNDIEKYTDKNRQLVFEYEQVKSENEALEKENKALRRENDFLKRTLERVKELYKEKIPGLAQMIGYVKAYFLDIARETLLKRHFTDDAEIEGAQKYMDDKQERKQELRSSRSKNRDHEMER